MPSHEFETRGHQEPGQDVIHLRGFFATSLGVRLRYLELLISEAVKHPLVTSYFVIDRESRTITVSRDKRGVSD